jgi:hypothetical protein
VLPAGISFNLRCSREAVGVGLKGSSIISCNSNDCLPCIFDDTASSFCLKESFLMNALYPSCAFALLALSLSLAHLPERVNFLPAG